MRRSIAIAAALFSAAARAACADVAVKPPFASSMVLQRNMANPIWGTASPGEEVTVTLGGRAKTAVAAPNGTWRVILEPMAEAGPLALVLKGKNTVTGF